MVGQDDSQVRTPKKQRAGGGGGGLGQSECKGRDPRVGESGWGGFDPPAAANILLPSLQGEWNLQPLPEITSKLEEPAPHCPPGRGQSPVGPTVVSIGGGKG